MIKSPIIFLSPLTRVNNKKKRKSKRKTKSKLQSCKSSWSMKVKMINSQNTKKKRVRLELLLQPILYMKKLKRPE